MHGEEYYQHQRPFGTWAQWPSLSIWFFNYWYILNDLCRLPCHTCLLLLYCALMSYWLLRAHLWVGVEPGKCHPPPPHPADSGRAFLVGLGISHSLFAFHRQSQGRNDTMDVKSYSRLVQADPSLVMDCPVCVLNPHLLGGSGRL